MIHLSTSMRLLALILIIGFVTICAAWYIESLGYLPCDLCLRQRWPYYLALPLAGFMFIVLALRLEGLDKSPAMSMGWLILVLFFFISMIMGIDHFGVEQGLWLGPPDCTGTPVTPQSIDIFIQDLAHVKVVRCDQPSFFLFGLSLSFWNVIVSAFLMGLALLGVYELRKLKIK